MRHILLTWNPGRYNDEQWTPEAWEADMVAGTAEGKKLDSAWSVGNRVRGIEPGDRAYMLRQGPHGRGLVAIGEITSEPFTDAHWIREGDTAQYVTVSWQEAVPIDRRVDIHKLEAAIPSFGWDQIYSSGREVTEHGAELERLWFDGAGSGAPLPPGVRGAGFGNAKENRKVERAAVRHVERAFQADGYQVTSVEAANCGWDLTVTRGEEELHVEVKGVSGSLPRFFLTANEYETALSDPSWVLVVVTDALKEPRSIRVDGPSTAGCAKPALYQVRIPDQAH